VLVRDSSRFEEGLYILMFGLSMTQCLYRCFCLGAFGADHPMRRNIDAFWVRPPWLEILCRCGRSTRLWVRTLQARGLDEFQFGWTLRQIVLPFLFWAMWLLCPPFVVARGIVPAFTADVWLQRTAFSLVFPGWAALLIAAHVSGVLRRWFQAWHDSIRDEKFLVGRQLVNAEFHAATPDGVSAPASPGIEDVGDEVEELAGPGDPGLGMQPPSPIAVNIPTPEPNLFEYLRSQGKLAGTGQAHLPTVLRVSSRQGVNPLSKK
jgi:hypothetical protein